MNQLPLQDSLYEAFRLSGLSRFGWKFEDAVRHAAVGTCLRNMSEIITRRRRLTCCK